MRIGMVGGAALLGLVALGCKGRDARMADTAAAPAAPGATAPAASPAEMWAVSFDGIGPVRVGMSYAEALAALGSDLSAPDSTTSCNDLHATRTPPGVSFMLVGDTIVRVDVRRPGVHTAEGAQVGDTEDEVRSHYGASVVVTPHKYTNGHYLTVRPPSAMHSTHRLVFETDGRVVTEYRAGRQPEVEWVEGCS